MNKLIVKQKILIYLLLVVSTVVFGLLSYNYYCADLQMGTVPQILTDTGRDPV